MSRISSSSDPNIAAATNPGPDPSAPLQVDDPFRTPLPAAVLLRVEGADWRRFLQGQLTCNVPDASATQALAGAYCTPKGRMVANFILICAADDSGAWLRLPADQAEALAQALRKYAVFFKVTLEIEQLAAVGLHIDSAAPPPPVDGLSGGARLACWHTGAATIIQLDEHGRRFEYWAPAAQLAQLQESLHALPVATPDYWRLLDIRAGYGQVVAETRELFLPQMLNLDLLGAVSFRKGCYTGQEVVARLHYRGKSKRRMRRIQGALAAGGLPPAAGSRIHNADGQPQGEVVDAVAVDGTQFEALAVLAESQLDADLQIEGSGTAIRLLPLPYLDDPMCYN